MDILLQVIREIDSLMPQLGSFIDQFNNTVTSYDVIPVTDIEGNLSIDVPRNMSISESLHVRNRLSIIDRLITTRGQQINELLQRGIEIENTIKSHNPNHVSYLTNRIEEFKRLNNSYKY